MVDRLNEMARLQKLGSDLLDEICLAESRGDKAMEAALEGAVAALIVRFSILYGKPRSAEKEAG